LLILPHSMSMSQRLFIPTLHETLKTYAELTYTKNV
jgi:hypothetical protein